MPLCTRAAVRPPTPAIVNSDQHRQGEPSAAAAAERHQRIGPRDADRHCGERNRQRQNKRPGQHEQRHICKGVTPTSTFDQFFGHGRNPVRISLVTNMAGEAGAVPAGLRRRFWRTAADLWRMVNGRLSLLSLSREVAGMTQATPGGGNMRKITGPLMASIGVAFGLAGERLCACAIGLSRQADPDPGRLLRGRGARHHLAAVRRQVERDLGQGRRGRERHRRRRQSRGRAGRQGRARRLHAGDGRQRRAGHQSEPDGQARLRPGQGFHLHHPGVHRAEPRGGAARRSGQGHQGADRARQGASRIISSPAMPASAPRSISAASCSCR